MLCLLRFESFNICMKFLVYTLGFSWLHAISNKLLFAQRLEIMYLSDFKNSKAKTFCVEATQSDDLRSLYMGSRDTGYLPFFFQGYRILSILLPGIWDTMFNFRDTANFPPKYTNTE